VLSRTRLEPVGSDRHGSLYWTIDALVWACNDNWTSQRAFGSNDSTSTDTGIGAQGCSVWRCYAPGPSLRRLMDFLNPDGPREGRLLQRLQRILPCGTNPAAQEGAGSSVVHSAQVGDGKKRQKFAGGGGTAHRKKSGKT